MPVIPSSPFVLRDSFRGFQVTLQNGCMNFMPGSHREAVAHIGDDADYAMTPSGQAVRGGEGDFFHKCDSRHEIAHLTAGLGSDFVHHL